VKFTDEGEIKIKLEPRSDQPGIDFEIIDTGIGIEESKLDSIFEPFHQTDSSTQRAHSGLGLGLTVARRMADLIGGTVTVNSKPGVGTRVMMRFPSQTSGSAALALHQRNYG
jgi:signal transduction histidine kinase